MPEPSVVFFEKKEVLLLNRDTNLVLEALGNTKNWFIIHVNVTDSSYTDQRIDNVNHSDTIVGDWYTLMRKNEGDSLSISISKNKENKRSLSIFAGLDIATARFVVVQEGK